MLSDDIDGMEALMGKTTRIYEYQARPALTVAIEQAQWMGGGCDVVLDSLHRVEDFHVPPAERKRLAAALDPEAASLRAQLAEATARAERAEQEAAEVHERRQQAERARDAAREQAAHWERRAERWQRQALRDHEALQELRALHLEALEKVTAARAEGRREGRADAVRAVADAWRDACDSKPEEGIGSTTEAIFGTLRTWRRAVNVAAGRAPDEDYQPATASPKAAPTNDPESPDGSAHVVGGWEALYGPDTRPPAYHEARARAERLVPEAAPVDLTQARAAAHADGAREALAKLRRGRSLEDVAEDYPGPESFGGEDFPMGEAAPEPVVYELGGWYEPGYSPGDLTPEPPKAAPAEPEDDDLPGDPKGVGEFMRMAENLLPRLHSGMVPERIVFKTEGGQIDGLIERVLEMIFGCEATAE